VRWSVQPIARAGRPTLCAAARGRNRRGQDLPARDSGHLVFDRPISVWSLPGAGPSVVIGRRVYPRRFVVYVADSVKRSVRARILAAVTAAHSAVAAKPCGRVEFDHRTYLLSRRPHGAGPGVGRILGAVRTVDCHGATEAGVRIYSVNEEDPARAITISQDGNVWLYSRH
jgi:hypothetical protein